MVAVDNKCLLLTGFTVVMYFMWMDIALWYNLQALRPSDPAGSSVSAKPDAGGGFSVFHPITVKMLMTDPSNHYILVPFCYVFTQVTRFTEVFTWVTPNMISILRIAVILPGLRLMLSESLGLRQAGVAVVLLGEWMDALDGYVARLQSSSHAMTSEVGELGYVVDGLCDGVSCTMLMLVCLAFLRRHPPRQSVHALQLPVICFKVDTSAPACKDNEALLGGGASPGPRMPVSARAILVTLLLFAGQLLLASVGWNRAIDSYQRTLQSHDGSHTARQLTILKSASTWILMWFWRVFCFHSMLHCFIISIFFNKVWEFLMAVRHVGYVALIVLVVLNEVHLQTIGLYL